MHVTAHIIAGGQKKKLDLWSGSNAIDISLGVFNVPVQALTRDQPSYGYSEKPPHFSRFLRYDTDDLFSS